MPAPSHDTIFSCGLGGNLRQFEIKHPENYTLIPNLNIAKMVNVFELGTIFTSLELALYNLSLIGGASKGTLNTYQLVCIVIAIVCFILELYGTRKKHYGLSIFSIVFRSIQVISCAITAILAMSALAIIVSKSNQDPTVPIVMVVSFNQFSSFNPITMLQNTMWKLQKFTLTLFWQKFRESGFTAKYK